MHKKNNKYIFNIYTLKTTTVKWTVKKYYGGKYDVKI